MLRSRLQFRSRGLDENGDPGGAFQDRFRLFADLDYQRGSEVAITNRIEGRQPVAIILRDTPQSRQVTPGWIAVVVGGPRDGEVFNIRGLAPDRQPGFFNMLGMSGVAPG